jgi:polyhydroxybutyrate depolymerase
MRKLLFLKILIFILFLSSGLLSQEKYCEMKVDKTKRTYIKYIPANIKQGAPLLIVLHGHGGTGKMMMNHTGFNEIADREKFIVVYPDGIDKGWNDFRKEINEKYDDAEFIKELIEKIHVEEKIDTSRIYATGISNGGFFSLYLANKLNGRITAIAPVTANLPEKLYNIYKLEKPVSLMLINGTKDPLVPYDGGKIGFKNGKSRGNAVSTDKTISKFVSLNNCNTVPKEEQFKDTDPDDDCTAVKYTYTGGLNNSEVVLIKVINGGHTWPGGSQYLPIFVVGNLCKDFSASEEIWNFFKGKKKE